MAVTALPQPNRRSDFDLHPAEVDILCLAVLERASGATGEAFFREGVAALAIHLDITTAFVAELLVEVDRAILMAGQHRGRLIEPFDFSVSDSPCAEVVVRGRLAHPAGVSRLYPRSEWFARNQAEAHAAVLLISSSGDPIGLLGVAHAQPIEEMDGILALLERLAPRFSAELERRQRDVALRRSESRFRLLVEASRDIMFYYRMQPDEAFEYISPAVTEITGRPPEAFFANPQLAIDMLDPAYRLAVVKAIEAGSPEPIVAKIVRPDGGTRWVEYRNFPFANDENRIMAIGGTIRDITLRVQAQEDLARSEHYRRAMLDAAPDTIFRLSASGAILDYVPGEALSELMSSATRPVPQGISDLLPLAYVAPAKRLITEVIRSGRMQRFEFDVPSDSETRSYEARCIPFGVDEMLLVVRDFTAMKWHAAEPERMRLRDELDVKVEGNLRLRNPYGLTYRELAVLHLVADGSADKQIAEALGISIYTANKHVGNILGKMNAASRTEAGVRALREGLLG